MRLRPPKVLRRGTRAVVTGAGSGLGRAIALQLARREGKVLVADIAEEGAEETATQVRDLGGEACVQRCDVTDPDEVAALADRADAEWGGADLLVNNAGVAVSGQVGEIPAEDWRHIVEINLLGMVWGCEAFVPRFRDRGAGAVLNVASAAGLLSPPLGAPYNATKAGVIALTETLAIELRGSGVTATVLCPTFFPTNLMDHARGPEKVSRGARKLMERSPLSADDVAHVGLAAVARGELYALPMADARRYWWIKRLSPGLYPRAIGRYMEYRQRKRQQRQRRQSEPES